MSARGQSILSPRAVLAELRLVVRQVGYEQLSFWLNPVGAIFTVGFSLLFLLLLGASAGSSRVSYLHNIKLVQYYVPGFIAYGVMSASFNSLAISLVIRRETGLLKRLRLSPLPTWTLLTSVLLSTLLIAFSQVVLMLAVGRWAFGVHLPSGASGVGALVAVLVIGGLSFAALGIAMSTFIPNQQAAGPVTSTVFFVLLFLSGSVVSAQIRLGAGQDLDVLPDPPLHHRRVQNLHPSREFSLVRTRPADRRSLGCGGRRGRASPVSMGAAPQLTTAAVHMDLLAVLNGRERRSAPKGHEVASGQPCVGS